MTPVNSDWTKWYCNVTHKMQDGIQYTICNYDNFAELTVYSWHSYQIIEKLYFFVRSIGEDCVNEKERYWNCGDIETAIIWAKHYVNRCYEMTVYKDDLSRFKYHLKKHL